MVTFTLSDGKEYSCSLKRNARAKRIILRRNHSNELIMTLPSRARINTKNIIELLQTNEHWIIQTQLPQISYPENIYLPSLEEAWKILYPPSGREKARLSQNSTLKHLIIEGASDVNEVSKLLNSFILKKAKIFLPERFLYCKKKFNFDSSESLRVVLLKSRWGSFSSKNILTLNARLILLPLHLIDYVIIHELCHANHLNHSKEFYKELSERLPQYKENEREIKQILIPPMLWH